MLRNVNVWPMWYNVCVSALQEIYVTSTWPSCLIKHAGSWLHFESMFNWSPCVDICLLQFASQGTYVDNCCRLCILFYAFMERNCIKRKSLAICENVLFLGRWQSAVSEWPFCGECGSLWGSWSAEEVRSHVGACGDEGSPKTHPYYNKGIPQWFYSQ